MLSLLIDAKENRDVDIKNDGQVNPTFEKDVVIENGKCVLYLQFLKALYGSVKAALIWYTLFSTVLKEMGFKLNPYDKCVANQMIEESQCTIIWYVDDNKISHISAKVVDEILAKIEKRFRKLTIMRGKQHTFLGMDTDFIGNSKVTIKMEPYIVECIEPYDLGKSKTAVTPAKNDLFSINEHSLKLAEDEAELLHSVVAKLLYISNRARPDILLRLAFLCTGVRN